MATEHVKRIYYGDDGTAYVLTVPTYYTTTTLATMWNTAPSGGEPALLPTIRMRRFHLATADGLRHRQFPGYTNNLAHWPLIGSTLNLPNIDGTVTAWTIVGYSDQKIRKSKTKR
jgi:hypothetical protein